MKKTFQKKSTIASVLRGLMLIIPIALLLVTVGCSDGNNDNDYTPANSDYSGQNDIENTAAGTIGVDQDENENASWNVEEEDYDIEVFSPIEIIAGEDGVIEITDTHFTLHMQEIQLNRNAFLGQTIRFSGLFLSTYWEGELIFFVARLEGGCCGFYGLEIYLNEFSPVEDETWVEVTGILEEFYVEEFGNYVLRLDVIDLVER